MSDLNSTVADFIVSEVDTFLTWLEDNQYFSTVQSRQYCRPIDSAVRNKMDRLNADYHDLIKLDCRYAYLQPLLTFEPALSRLNVNITLHEQYAEYGTELDRAINLKRGLK